MIDASIWSRGQLSQYGKSTERSVAFGLMALSVAGTYFGLTNGTMVWRQDTFVFAIVLQAIFTLFQYVHVKNWKSPWYLMALGLSVIPSAVGYKAIVVPVLAPLLADNGIEHADAAALIIVIVASIGIDIMPERILVKK